MSNQDQRPIADVMHKDFVSLRVDWTVQQALESLRGHAPQDRAVYLYVTDDQGLLSGVVPVRRMLAANPQDPLRGLMIARVAALPASATLHDAMEMFVLHRFLAMPVIDASRKLLGVVDVSAFTDEMLDHAERQQTDTLFETLGVRAEALKGAGPIRAFRGRFPWLLATIAGGTTCALLAGIFERTLQESIVLAFFLTLVLGLGESVAAQSMSVTVNELRGKRPGLRDLLASALRELGSVLLLGAAAGTISGLAAWAWHRHGLAAGVIGGAILASVVVAGLLGRLVPTLMHVLKLDPRVASGPVALALADLCTITIYLGIATLVLLR